LNVVERCKCRVLKTHSFTALLCLPAWNPVQTEKGQISGMFNRILSDGFGYCKKKFDAVSQFLSIETAEKYPNADYFGNLSHWPEKASKRAVI